MSAYAAGYYEEVIRGLGRLAIDEEGQRCAAALTCALPPAIDIKIEIALAQEVGATGALRDMRKYADLAERAHAVCCEAIGAADSILGRVAGQDGAFKAARKLKSTEDSIIGFAIAASKVDADPAIVRIVAWRHLIGWAQRLRGAYPAWHKNKKLFDTYDDEWSTAAYVARKTEEYLYERYSRARSRVAKSRSRR